LEGVRLIEDALLANFKMGKLFMLKSSKEVPEQIKGLMTEDVEIHRLGQKHMQVWSSVTTPPGVIGKKLIRQEGKTSPFQPSFVRFHLTHFLTFPTF